MYVDGVRIYRNSDSAYASGSSLTGFLEDGDVSNSKLNGLTSIDGAGVTWASTTDTVWYIDTANQLIYVDQSAIVATDLYGEDGMDVSFSSGTTIIELKRGVSDESGPSVDFSNASILTEQDLDNSSKNVFHLAQQAVVIAENTLSFNVGTGVYQAYQPGTTTNKKITQVADGAAANDAINFGQLTATEVTTGSHRDDAIDAKDEATDYATRTGAVVRHFSAASGGSSGAGVDQAGVYSAKEHAVGTTTPSAKDYATKLDAAVTGTDYSAKEHAIGDGNSDAVATGGSAKSWAQTAVDTKVPGAGSSDRSALHLSLIHISEPTRPY